MDLFFGDAPGGRHCKLCFQTNTNRQQWLAFDRSILKIFIRLNVDQDIIEIPLLVLRSDHLRLLRGRDHKIRAKIG